MNNPPAFPRAGVVDGSQMLVAHNDGMTLRDYFAAAAMQGILANPEFKQMGAGAVAEEAFITAQAMLKAREQ